MAIESSRTVRWNIVVSEEVDRELRIRIAEQGGRKGDLSRFVEEAVSEKLFETTVREIKADNVDLSEDEADELIEEALAWARSAAGRRH
ncbi:MAG: ribbon-helix-helix domain-containing protein [Thermomicrobiales bacterium]